MSPLLKHVKSNFATSSSSSSSSSSSTSSPSSASPTPSPSPSPSSPSISHENENAESSNQLPTNRQGPISWKSVVVLFIAGSAAIAYYQYQRDRALHQVTGAVSVGTALIGGPFDLVDHSGKRVTSEDFRGKYMLIYFGFTNCPDICPNELKKMEEALRYYQMRNPKPIVPIFISIDPKRDTPTRLDKYRKDFNPNMVWLTGSHEQISQVAKAFRVYFSAPELKPGEDEEYLVDHSIFFYLLDTQGNFMDYMAFNVGKTLSAEDVSMKLDQLVKADLHGLA